MATDDTPGIDRRLMLKRSAVVGGALVWATPLVQSIGGVAFADGSPFPETTYGYTFTTSNGTTGGVTPQDQPNIDLTNQSDPGIFITSFTLSIGQTTKNFDRFVSRASVGIAGSDYVVSGIDTLDGGARADAFTVSFVPGSFEKDDIFRFGVEVDPDSSNGTTNYRTVFFNNGNAVPNSQLTVTFSNGQTLTQPLSDGLPGQTNYTFSQSSA